MGLFSDIVKIGTGGLVDLDKKAPSAPTLPAAPEWKDSFYYDEEGRLSGSITKDAQGNIVYKPRQLTAAESVQKKAIESTRQSLLQRLYQTPEEYTRAAQEEAEAWAAPIQRQAGEQFQRDVNRIGEVSNVRGLYGSKAHADILADREKTQAEQAADIAGRTTAMRQDLIDRKKAGDYGLYNLYSGALGEYDARSAAGLQATSGLSSMMNQFNQQNWATTTNAMIANYQNQLAEFQANDPWRNYVAPIVQAGATILANRKSDRRLKKNIVPVFKVGDVQFYEFEYDESKWPEGALPPQRGLHIGVMADEVEHIPDVVEKGVFLGYDMVRYDTLRRHLKMENA